MPTIHDRRLTRPALEYQNPLPHPGSTLGGMSGRPHR